MEPSLTEKRKCVYEIERQMEMRNPTEKNENTPRPHDLLVVAPDLRVGWIRVRVRNQRNKSISKEEKKREPTIQSFDLVERPVPRTIEPIV